MSRKKRSPNASFMWVVKVWDTGGTIWRSNSKYYPSFSFSLFFGCALIYRILFQVVSPIKDGIVVDWDIVDNIWDHAFRYFFNILSV